MAPIHNSSPTTSPYHRRIYFRFILSFFFCSIFVGCGTFFTELPNSKQTLDGPIAGLTPTQLSLFLDGDEAFSEMFTPATGLGPVFNQVSCASCHTADGKGHPSTNLTRFGIGDPNNAAQFNYLLEWGGPQLQNHAIPGYSAEKLEEIQKRAKDKWPNQSLALSVRSGPIVTGLGLIEAIPDEEILKHADPEDKDGDGIRGRPNYVSPPPYFEPIIQHVTKDGKYIGRFGRKATAINLLHQVVSAYINDMGITSDFVPTDVFNPLVGSPAGTPINGPEVSSRVVRSVVFYMQTLRPPERRDENNPDVKRGEQIFQNILCSRCHIPALQTGNSPIEPLHNKTVPLYSDLLLHDMGDKLADQYPEGSATGRDWRTTPLWGLGIISAGLGGKEYYLHDGRATTLDEAIRLHGGEAQKSTDAYLKLSPDEQKLLMTFLRSL